MIKKTFGIDFNSEGGALTLSSGEISSTEIGNYDFCGRKHKSGWTIVGQIQEDYYVWVNEFFASHPKYGYVFGNFENNVYASSEEGYQHFYNHHQPETWDYMDI